MADEIAREEAPSVLPIDRTSVHQICSGQVVLNLATAMKELVENSIDAGATNIEIKLKENGSELIEVSDNGSGVEPKNFEALTLKHYTSKLRDFSDLSSVETFGFRGEALSSLCALSDLSITTRHTAETAGTKLEYDHSGKLKLCQPCAREHGTTVIIQNLFSTLPVRHKEFLRNVKKEFVKLVHVLQGYCLISSGIRITCSNQTTKGKKSVVVSTHGSDLTKDNITAVFGPKQIQTLKPFQQIQPSEEDCSELNISHSSGTEESSSFDITGYISSANHGMGRSSADRQFLFINKRPCDLAKVSRVVNEVYHMFNRHQYPFVMLDISLRRDAVDVNVTPDKRQVFVLQEKLLLATVRSSLKRMFDPGTSSYEVNQKILHQIKINTPIRYTSGKQPKTSEAAESPSFHGNSMDVTDIYHGNHLDHDGSHDDSLDDGELDVSLRKDPNQNGFNEVLGCPGNEVCRLEHTVERKGHEGSRIASRDVPPKLSLSSLTNFKNNKRVFSTISSKDDKIKEPLAKQMRLTSLFSPKSEPVQIQENENLESENGDVTSLGDHVMSECKLDKRIDEGIRESAVDGDEFVKKSVSDSVDQTPNIKQDKKKRDVKTGDDLQDVFQGRKEVKVEFSLERLKRTARSNMNSSLKPKTEARCFRAKISPENNTAAEDELTKNITKDSFTKMEIIGQFNLGFALVKLGQDLFIIDQHAADEKYNFEDQQRNTTLQTQRLIIPKKLDLTAVNECILIDNLEIFRKNGFEFEVDENAPSTQKIKLVSLPMNKNWTFDVGDIEELIFMLSDAPGVLCRPSRVRKMFASRACRMSVMVGTALSHAEMRKITLHMASMEHPWNCPHGRPTMRHVINLSILPTD